MLVVCNMREAYPCREKYRQISQHSAQRRADPTLCAAARAGIGKRSLQRLFNEYVGASPKWVIRRCRLHEALERLHAGVVDVAGLAAELGYFDQAHLIQDFKTIVGVTPGQYQLSLVTKPAQASSSLPGRAR